MSIRILIAEDNASVRSAMRRVLERVGEHWEIIEAENGEDAVAKAQDFRPEVVILDLVMPLKDGMAASREIAKVLPEVPILMHTLYSSPQVQLEAEKVGVLKVVPKSDTSVLVAAVQEVVHSRPSAAGAPPASEQVSSETHKRRREDKIRELCNQLLALTYDKSQAPMFIELREALHQYIEKLRERVAHYPAVRERRGRNEVLRLDR